MAISEMTWHEVFDACQGRCQYCGADLVSSLLAYRCAEVDHLLPPSNPDRDKPENLVLACRPCNGSLSRAHGLGLFTVAQRKAYLEGTNAGFEARRIQHFKAIYGRTPVE
ncbi:HNH endonuclease [Noviherbaspirillum galbum]|uniref:HNH endonuclease n=1 Tax=Noviherbaspirillum galbum TaxID=2709383 RepID=A0A6B3SHC3_9BURK|nr:HNH endonuclease signature motif containing protein [Noviherbaspirillum galbum]NEX60050.1 HNH endonuclease [Noviherbaspirillum galbum]